MRSIRRPRLRSRSPRRTAFRSLASVACPTARATRSTCPATHSRSSSTSRSQRTTRRSSLKPSCRAGPAPESPLGIKEEQHARLFRSLAELAGLVVACGLLDYDVPAVEGVDEGDEADQCGELIVVIMLGGVGPNLVGDTARSVGETGALLCQLQGCALRLGEHLRLTPGSDEIEPRRGLSGQCGLFGVHVETPGAAIDLARTDLHQFLRRRGQRR